MFRAVVTLVLVSAALSGCAAATSGDTVDPMEPPVSAPEPGPVAGDCDWFNRTEPDSWTAADPDLLADWGVSRVDVPGGCQQVTDSALRLGWYDQDEDVCTPVLSIVQPQLDAAGYVTVDQTADDALTRTFQATSADGADIVAISCSLPAVGDDAETDGSVTLMAYHA